MRILPVVRDGDVDVGAAMTVQVELALVLAERLDGLFQVDLVAVDLDAVLRLEGGRDVLVRDGAQRLVLGPNLQSNHDRLVVHLVRHNLPVGALLPLPLYPCLPPPLPLPLRPPSPPRPHPRA